MDTLEIVTPRERGGSIRIVGKAHGAINCIVTPAEDSGGWFFKQFVSRTELEDYVTKFNLVMEATDEEQN